MLNSMRPGTLLAVMAVFSGTVYWLVFSACCVFADKLGSRSYFNDEKWIFIIIGLMYPAIGLAGGIVNKYKDNDYDDRPIWIMGIGVLFIVFSAILYVCMIARTFGGPISLGGEG